MHYDCDFLSAGRAEECERQLTSAVRANEAVNFWTLMLFPPTDLHIGNTYDVIFTHMSKFFIILLVDVSKIVLPVRQLEVVCIC